MNRRTALLGVLATAALLAVATPSALAAIPAPHWFIQSATDNPDVAQTRTNFTPAQGGTYAVTAIDVGALPTDGSEVILTDTLPAALKVKAVVLGWIGDNPEGPLEKETGKTVLTSFCTTTPARCAIPASYFTAEGPIRRDDQLRMFVTTTVKAGAEEGPLINQVSIEGGGAPRAEAQAENQLTEALPPFGPTVFSSYFADPAGAPPTQAGEHPYGLTTPIALANASSVHGPESGRLGGAIEDLRDVLVDLPPGLAGSALAANTCSFAQLGGGELREGGDCPAGSAVGSIITHPDYETRVFSLIDNMVPEHGVAAEFAFNDGVHGAHVLDTSIVPSPAGYVLRVTSPEITQVSLTEILTAFYGDPAARDAIRPEEAADVPLFTNPTDCSGEPLVTTIHMDSWQHPGTYNPDGSPNLAEPNWVTKAYEAPPVTGCDKLAGLFNPEIEATPTTDQADKPTGLDVDLKVPQSESIETLGTPPLKRAVVTLPAGMSVNPSSANGLQGCSLAQIGVSASGQPNAAAPNCPDASKIGSLELETPALPGSLEGSIYVAKQSENPFASLLAIYLVVDDPKTGVIVKLPGEVRADPVTGQLQTVIDNSPQFPFSELRTHFLAGQRAALRTPAVCGKYEVTSELTPWSAPESGPPATPSGSFEITQGCAKSAAEEPNDPLFSAGTLSPLAATYSPGLAHLSRADGSQQIRSVTATLPPGLLAKLAGVAQCSDAQIAAASAREVLGGGAQEFANPSCPAASQVGTVTVGAGAGLEPFYVTAPVYLAGPYKGAPLSGVVIVPAVAGPFDLGTVVNRAPISIDPETGVAHLASEEIPQLRAGIPLDLRSLQLNLDRPEFVLNPSNCERMSVSLSVQGTSSTADLAVPFQVGGCKALPFKPKLSLRLKGSVKRTANPALIADLTMRPGEANIARAQVKLPPSAFLDQAHIGLPCTRVQFAAHACPASSVIGRVSATTPLIEGPLTGNVYLRTNPNHKLPDVVADLNGPANLPVEVTLQGKTDSVKGALRNTFEAVPDAPVSSFRLELFGGKRGLVEMSSGFCRHPKAAASFLGQNGKVSDTTPVVASSCKKPKQHGGKHHHKHHSAG